MVSLEFRKAYRKEINLPGTYTLLPEKIHTGRMLVLNVSKTGVGLQVVGKHRLSVDEELEVSFVLDDVHDSKINKKVVIKLVQGKYVGCEFLDVTSHDKALGFYLMV